MQRNAATTCLIVLVLLIAAVPQPAAIDFRLTAGADIPLGPVDGDGSRLYGLGGGATLAAEFTAPSGRGLVGQALVGYDLISTPARNSLSLISFGAGVGVSLAPIPMLAINLAGAGGYAVELYPEQTSAGSGPFALAEAGLSFQPTPLLSLGVGAAYKHFWSVFSDGGALAIAGVYNGLAVSLGVSLHPGALRSSSRIQIREVEIDPVFPVFFKYYESHPVGKVRIQNKERGAISNVRVSLFVPQYMDKPKVSEPIQEIKRNQEAEVPLHALFTEKILQVTEGTRVVAEIRVQYSFGAAELENEETHSLEIYFRNAMTWDDDRKAASFVTAKDPGVLKFAKAVAGLARAEGAAAVSLPLRQAMGIFESLALYGLQYVVDPNSSYIVLSKNESTLDYLQFPIQTLTYRGGDCDDLSILYSALLESVAIETAFITVPGHIYVAFAMELGTDEAARLFNHPEELIIRDDKVWLPVEITMVQEGFLKAWQQGAKQWREHSARQAAALYPIREAWKLYQPTGIIEKDSDVVLPDMAGVLSRYRTALSHFVEGQIGEKEQRLLGEIQKSGNDPRLINKLGVLYAQFGLVDKGEAEFRRASSSGYVPALINLGNLALAKKDMKQALDHYGRAHNAAPDNAAAILGLARAYYELENYGSVREMFARLQRQDPELAMKFAYLGSRQSEETRASDSTPRETAIWADE